MGHLWDIPPRTPDLQARFTPARPSTEWSRPPRCNLAQHRLNERVNLVYRSRMSIRSIDWRTELRPFGRAATCHRCRSGHRKKEAFPRSAESLEAWHIVCACDFWRGASRQRWQAAATGSEWWGVGIWRGGADRTRELVLVFGAALRCDHQSMWFPKKPIPATIICLAHK